MIPLKKYLIVLLLVQPGLLMGENTDLPKDPVLSLTFDADTFSYSGKDVIVHDFSKNKHKVVISKGGIYRGQAGQALLSATADSSYGTIEDVDFLSSAKEFSISAWFKFFSFYHFNYIVSKENWDNKQTRGFYLQVDRKGRPEFVVGGPNNTWHAALGAPLKTNTWYHLVGTYDEKQIHLWLDGKKIVTIPSPGERLKSPNLCRIGKGTYDPKREYNGSIDEVSAYDRALTKEEVEALYKHGKSGKPQYVLDKPLKNALGHPIELLSKLGQVEVEKVDRNKYYSVSMIQNSSKKFAVVTLNEGRLELQVGNSLESVGKPKKFTNLPFQSKEVEELNACWVGTDRIAVFAGFDTDNGKSTGHLSMALLPISGRSQGKWVSLNKNFKFDFLIRTPYIVPVSKSKSLLMFHGGMKKKSAFLTASLSKSGVRKLKLNMCQPNEEPFGDFVYEWRPSIGNTKKQYIIESQGSLYWKDPRTCKRTLMIEKTKLNAQGDFSISEKDFSYELKVSPRGDVYLITTKDGTILRDPWPDKASRLVLGRGKLGSKLKVTPFEPGLELYPPHKIIFTPKGKPYYFAMVKDSRKPLRNSFRLLVWDLSKSKPKKKDLNIISGEPYNLQAIFTDESTAEILFISYDSEGLRRKKMNISF